MVLYKYALNSTGTVVTAESLAGTEISDIFTCLSCGQPLIARVNGTVQQPHFGHKAQVECNGETYLHRLAKQVFLETYTECLKQGRPFLIKFHEPKICSKYKWLISKTCNIGIVDHDGYDLTDYYTEIKVETRDGQFIPDISLHSKTNPDEIVYIEIAALHFLSKKKLNSCKRIIEIAIKKEEDVEIIRSAIITGKDASFIGFSPKYEPVTDAECRCHQEMFFAFLVFSSGKAYLDHLPLKAIHSRLKGLGSKVIYVNLIHEDDTDSYIVVNGLVRSELFIEQVRIAQKRQVPIKNCYLCCHHSRNNKNKLTDLAIFCKKYGKPCNSNEAAACNSYSLQNNQHSKSR